MTKFIVHIGDGKCGSTAIQNALYQSRKSLKDDGIYFDTLAPNSGHTAISLLAGQHSRAASGKREALARDILKLLQENCQKYEWVVLSAENFINLAPKSAADLLAAIGCPIESINVVAYIRNSPEMYASSIQQIVKASYHFPFPESYHRRVDLKLKAWKDWIGADRIEVRLFDRQYLTDGDVVADFSQYLSNITGKNLRLSSNTSNRSLSVEQTRVLQKFRRAVYPAHNDKILPGSNIVVQFFAKLNAIRFVGNPTVISDLAYDIVSSRNVDVMHGLLECFPDLPLSDIPQCSSPPQKGPFPWTTSESVETVFAFSDQKIVAYLSELLPDLNDGACLDGARLEEALTNLGLSNKSDREEFYVAYQSYLEARLLYLNQNA